MEGGLFITGGYMPIHRFPFLAVLVVTLVGCSFGGAPSTSVPPALPTSPPATPTASPATAIALPGPSSTRSPLSGLDLRSDLLPEFTSDVPRADPQVLYELDLRLDPSGPELTGRERVQYSNKSAEPLNDLCFRLFGNYPGSGGQMGISNVLVGGRPTVPVLQVQNTAACVVLPTPLLQNQAIQVEMDLSQRIPISDTVRYADLSATGGIITLPSTYALIPARADRGWHLELPPPYGDLVNADVGAFRVRVTAPATLTVVMSGSIVATTDNGDGTRTWDAVADPVRDFSLNASDRWDKTTVAAGPVKVNSYFLPEHRADGQAVAQWVASAVQVFGKRIGAYPYRELDVLETPTTAGGIEYPGLVVIARNLYKNPQQRDFFQFAVIHEVAHQWFYGLVGDDQVNHPWMDESLVQYVTSLYYEDTQGPAVAQRVRQASFEGLYREIKGTPHDKPIGLPVAAYENDREYSQVVYGKGPLFFAAVRQALGDDLFNKWLRTYFERFEYKNAAPADLLATLNEVAGRDLSALYHEWVGP